MEDTGEKVVFLDRTSRATRGKRMSKILDEELDEDEKFWNQDALKEEEHDLLYEAEDDDADEFDSDFDEDESEADDEPEVDVDERDRAKKRLMPPGKSVSKKKSLKRDLSKLGAAPKVGRSSSPRQAGQDLPEQHDGPDEIEVEKSVRKSTRTAVMAKQAERAMKVALQTTMRPIKKKKEGEERRMTQEEMLLEAAETEIQNLRNLERVLAREEEVKKRAVLHKEVYSGPQTRYISREGKSFLEFTNGVSFESELCGAPVSYPEKCVCAVTGAAAKYCDPKTGLYYATKEAFKIIRECYAGEKSNQPKDRKHHEGDLLEYVSGNGFSGKRKRSTPASSSPASFRYGARFLNIPSFQLVDSD